MQSKAESVTTYLAEQPDENRPVLKKLRGLIRKAAPQADESMRYGMPCYELDGEMLCAFALQKGYLAFYFCNHPLVQRFKTELGTKDCGKGCIRYRQPAAIPLEVIGRMIKAAVEEKDG